MGGPPVALVAISAASAAIGAVDATVNTVGNQSSGVHIGHCSVHYPKEFPSEQFAHGGQSFERDLVKFHAQGGIWDNDIAVSATGYISHDHSELLGRPDSAHPNIPVNRFILLSLDKSANSEDMSSGLLNCDMELWGGASDVAEGTPDDPWVALHVHGRFDPVGVGDAEFSFKLLINSFGQISVSNENITGTAMANMTITNHGEYVTVWI